MSYRHHEAFCLMQYQDEVTGEIEILWNSRDGVTPFIIGSRAGNSAQHVNWKKDECRPDFVPTPGMRIFVDASPKHAHIQESAKGYVDKFWCSDMSASLELATKEQAVEFFITEWTKPGSPTIIEAE